MAQRNEVVYSKQDAPSKIESGADMLGQAFEKYQKKQFADAKAIISHAFNKDDKDYKKYSYYLLGNIEFAQESFQEAYDAYSNALALSTNEDDFHTMIKVSIDRSIARRNSGKADHNNDFFEKGNGELNYANKESIKKFNIYPTLKNNRRNVNHRQSLHQIQQAIEENVNDSFRHNIASRVGLSGDTSIYIDFEINETGTAFVKNVRAINPLIEQEIIRIFDKLPNFRPAQQSGTTEAVAYNFKLKKDIGWYEKDIKRRPRNFRIPDPTQSSLFGF
jgi:tetratricopeptide (TPR) repeat protein